ncbi:MAG: AhpC/TSA family protein [Prevotella sp.]|nr:AhpC/TSA family protein [Prevotella sp.]
MNKISMFIIGLMAASSMLAACQLDGYRIKGSGDALKNGDTLLVMAIDGDSYHPIDTVVVKDGEFETSGRADSTAGCVLVWPRETPRQLVFFIEPGTISMTISDTPEKTRVAGTKANDIWQTMQDSINVMARESDIIGSSLQQGNLPAEEVEAKNAELRRIKEAFVRYVNDCAEKNIGNEVGYFLLINSGPMIKPEKQAELIGKLPEQMKNRPAVKTLLKKVKTTEATPVGSTIKNFTMDDIDGKPVDVMTEIARHKITVLDFWASWCGPCRAEMPGVVRLYDAYESKGLGIIGISLDSKKEAWVNAVKGMGMRWVQLSDLNGWDNAAARMFYVQSIPQTIVVDSKGTILARGLRGEELDAFVAARLK